MALAVAGGEESPLRARQIYAGHLALTDANAGRTVFAERLRRAGTPLAQASKEDLDVVLEDKTFSSAGVESLWAAFHALHEARFGFAIAREVIEIITIKCTAIARTEKPQMPDLPRRSSEPVAQRAVWFETGAMETPIYKREHLGAGTGIDGPALVEEGASVTVLRPEQVLAVETSGHLSITNKPGAAS